VSRRELAGDLRLALVPWALARVIVGSALALARFVFGEIGSGRRPDSLVQGLFAWDASFYREIADRGYHRAGGSLRFFPLVPLLARGLGVVLAGHREIALLLVANGSALVFSVLLCRLARSETGDPRLARRAVWIGALAPPALTLVLGYAEATLMMLAAGAFLALRGRRWGWAMTAGLLAGLCRPVGALLVAPAAIEAARGWRSAPTCDRAARAASIVAPIAGTGAYLAWVGVRFGDAFLPLRLQEQRSLRGKLMSPVSSLAHAAGDLLGGERFGSGLHFVWALVFLAVLVVIARRLPASYSVYAGLTLLSALSARNLDSLERYALSAFPFVLGAAILTGREDVELPVLVLAGAGLAGYAVLTFLGLSIP